MSIKIALAGNPNCGKTTLFNNLTGSNQYVGNWPGVTVEKKEGKLKGDKDVVIQDLPGIYSLSPYTLEEVVSRTYLVKEKPDAILNIIDGTNIERNLYLTTQLIELGIPVVMAVNMIDLVRKNGDKIDLKKLSAELGCQAVEISALKGEGTEAAAKAAVAAAPIFAIPNFTAPKFNMEAIMIIMPVILVITSEHIGHQVVTSKIIGRDLLKDPGLHRSIFGDNFSTMVSGLIGSVPTTTYGENIGVMAVTKVYSVQVIAGAAVISIICSFIGKLSTLIQTIPGPVIGGISFLLYGMIGTSGLRILVDSKVDYSKNRNQALTAVIFVTGLSGIKVNFGNVQLTGMVLACVVGMILSLIFYIFDKMKLTNDQ